MLIRLLANRDDVLELLVKERSVGEPGERVVEGQLAQLRLRLALAL